MVGGAMVANSLDLIDRIFLGDGNIWVLASYHALPYINSGAIGVHDVGICVVDSLLEWHILHVSSIC